ncbi:menaquinone biosynthetic enzyme MqnA/MqnD family protein [Aeoliella sp.]|uniref:menaquinone biosynthetic enzyme MqnA/MqnD family protein n=1 Tax=Aeoliella sp. TaxID=2795800 RepID=UPI003CCBDD31
MDLVSTSREALRIGAVSYLNSKPLVHGLTALEGAQVRFDLPSRLADDLSAGRLDVALVPIVEYLRHPEYQLLSSACVACWGPVLSVKLYFRTPPEEVQRLALDEGSRTSAALAQILLAQLHDVRPQLVQLPIGDSIDDVEADAVLLIGDRAMQTSDDQFAEVWDLGDRWCRWTELPFVFAAWVARPDLPVHASQLADVFDSVRDRGVAAIESIVAAEAANLGLEPALVRDYLTRYLHFTLAKREQLGVELFAKHCRELGLVEASRSSLEHSS